jgi:hypothetical protein
MQIDEEEGPHIQVLTEVKVHLISEPSEQFLRVQRDKSQEVLRTLHSQIAKTAHDIKKIMNTAGEEGLPTTFLSQRPISYHLGPIIKRTIRKKNPSAIANLLRQHPDLLFVDDVDLAISLALELSSEELEELLNEPFKNIRKFKIPLSNPFRAYVRTMSFLTAWGDDEEKRVARKWLQDAGLQSFIKLRRGRPQGSVKYSKSQVVADYKRILRYLQEERSNKNVRLYADKRRIIIQCLTKEFTNSIPTIEDNVPGERYRIKKIANKLTPLKPFPSNAAIHITGLLQNISPSTVSNILYRTKA